MATSLPEALRKEPRAKPDDAYIDDEWAKANPNQLISAIGYEMDEEDQPSGSEAKRK